MALVINYDLKELSFARLDHTCKGNVMRKCDSVAVACHIEHYDVTGGLGVIDTSSLHDKAQHLELTLRSLSSKTKLLVWDQVP